MASSFEGACLCSSSELAGCNIVLVAATVVSVTVVDSGFDVSTSASVVDYSTCD